MSVSASRPIAMRAGPREWTGLAVLSLAGVLIAMDNTVLFLALPHVTADLGASGPQMLWIQDVYGFLVAGLLITMGTLGDRIGRRRLLMLGAAGFGVASVLAALSTGAEMLIAARAVLGIAGAALVPSILGILRNVFADPKQRIAAISVLMTCFTTGGAIAPLIGGLLLESFWWGAVFLAAVPVMALILLLAPILLPESADPGPGRLDLPSVGLSVVAILPTVYGVKELAGHGMSLPVLLGLVIGATFTVLFIRRQNRMDSPLLDLQLFRGRTFSVALGALLVGQFAIGGVLFLMPQYFQLVLNKSPIQAGLWLLPGTGIFALMALVIPPIAGRLPRAWLMAGGLIVAAAGYGLLAMVDPGSGHGTLVVAMVLVLAGMAPLVLLVTDLVVASAPQDKAGFAAAMSSTSIELGLALGVASLGSVLAAVYGNGMSDVPAGVPAGSADAARASLASANGVAQQLPDPVATSLLTTAREAFIAGFNVVGVISAMTAVGAAVAVAWLLRDITATARGRRLGPHRRSGPTSSAR
ncbi:MFS transporter [Nonomuraea sp. KM90]|uniref:MFS transporter n=1 Tax=Nonomuraea sp. KM90 TaxID=3457428 RepID=UPI003FCDDA41